MPKLNFRAQNRHSISTTRIISHHIIKSSIGPKPQYTDEHVQNQVRTVPAEQRTTMRDIVAAAGISMGTLCRHLKKGTLQRRSSRIKPLLTQPNKSERVEFCCSNAPAEQPRTECARSWFLCIDPVATIQVNESHGGWRDSDYSGRIRGAQLWDVFLTFQAVMRLVLEHGGDNQFKLPHLKKASLRRAGLLMSNVSCPVSLLS